MKDPDYDKRAAFLEQEAAKLDRFAEIRERTYQALYDNLPDSIAVLKGLQVSGGSGDGVKLQAAKTLLALAEIGPKTPSVPANPVLEVKITQEQSARLSEANRLIEEDL